MTPRLATLVLTLLVTAASASAQRITPPADFFGFEIGADGELARWDKIVEYYEHDGSRPAIASRSIDLGPSTEGHPYLLVDHHVRGQHGERLERLRRGQPRGFRTRARPEAEVRASSSTRASRS